MKKLLLSLITLSLLSCSKDGFEIQNEETQTKKNQLMYGFVNTPTVSDSNKVWQVGTNPWTIYGFYSSHTKKHMYSNSPLPSELPRTQPGQYYNFLERTLGAADDKVTGKGNMITAWFNINNEDLVLTTNPNEFNGQPGWKKDRDLGKSFLGSEEGSFPIYRYYRNSTSSHFYTRDKNELGDGNSGFVYEGVAFYLKESGPWEFRIQDGTFYKDINTGYYYIVMESQLRILESLEMIRRVFDFRPDTRYGLPGHPIIELDIQTIKGTRGPAISANAYLTQDVNTGMRYFNNPQNGRGNLKIIPNDVVFSRYNFHKDNVQKVTGTNNSRLQELKITY
ncbi:hypothetical protein [Pedobacter steynii]|uniref:DUF5648 domain-containing protein n=1 Tax=Pedobacter steynii TaxID=430522 RepID=A0A1D7QL67_9SPHI|nr:hypothetical protein [Pedobacter steynii]AOM79387.1 hypothetical protein BFS30_20770 [Pedobacter steynii]